MATSELLQTAAATASVVVPVAGAAVVYMRLYTGRVLEALKLDMANLRMDLLRQSDELYVRRSECSIIHEDLRERVDRVESRLSRLEAEI